MIHTQKQWLHWSFIAVILRTAVLAAGKRRECCRQMSGQSFWWLQSFSCICLYMLTIVANVPELTQMRPIQGRSSDMFLSKFLLAVLFNPGIPRQLGAHWPPKTSKREWGSTRVFQHICDYLQSHQLPEPER